MCPVLELLQRWGSNGPGTDTRGRTTCGPPSVLAPARPEADGCGPMCATTGRGREDKCMGAIGSHATDQRAVVDIVIVADLPLVVLHMVAAAATCAGVPVNPTMRGSKDAR